MINRSSSPDEAQSTARRIAEVSQKFLGREPRWVGTLPEDRAAFRSIQRREPVVLSEPGSKLSVALEDLSVTILEELSRGHPRGIGRSLLRRVGTTPAYA